jgi:hypothetical protein
MQPVKFLRDLPMKHIKRYSTVFNLDEIKILHLSVLKNVVETVV